MLSQIWSGGFYVTRLASHPGWGQTPLPERSLTLSDCLTVFLPGTWALDWVSESEEERAESMRRLGLGAQQLPELMEAATAAFSSDELGWPGVWQSLSAARAFRQKFAASDPEIVIVELGVPDDAVGALVAQLVPGPQEGEPALYSRLQNRTALEPSGVSLGWEVLGLERGGSLHSWLCNHLQDSAAAQLGIQSGALGLLQSEADARAVCGMIQGGVGAEPVPWFPGLLRQL